MAGFKGHLWGATVFFIIYLLALVYVFTFEAIFLRFDTLESAAFPVTLFGLCLMFGLWPDVDTNSFAQDVFYGIFFFVDVTLIAARQFQEAAYLGLFAILPVLGKHRGWTHTYWAMILVPSPLIVLPFMLVPDQPLSGLPFYGAAVTGYFSHLVMDGLTLRLNKKRRKR